MGMFDTLYDAHGNDWQTKAFDRNLDEYEIGDEIPADGPATYQVTILGDKDDGYEYSLATVRDGILASVNDERDTSLPLIDYSGRVHLDQTGGEQ